MRTTEKKNKKPLIMLTAGGTGGHVYPAEALAEELEQRGFRLMLVTDCRGKDNYKGKLGQIPNYAVWCGSVIGKSPWHKGQSLIKTMIGILQASWLVIKEKPSCVVGFGGYASFPASVAALLAGVDLVIHEQNSVMSRTNRFLSRYASLIAQSFKNTKYAPDNVKTVVTGMPVRANIAACGNLDYCVNGPDNKFELLVLGGSQGAKIFGEVMPQVIKSLPEELQKKIKIYQQCRKGEEEILLKAYENCVAEVEVKHFFDNMAELYGRIQLVISRSGASSVSEIAVAGIPSLLVPLPTAADDHQTSNAAEIAEAKAGIVVLQKEFVAENVGSILEDLLGNQRKLQQMSASAKKNGIKDAAKRLADTVENLITHTKR